MTNSDQFDSDEPEDRESMSMNSYSDAPYIIPGLRVRRVSPTERVRRRSDDDNVLRRAAEPPDLRDLSKTLKSVTIEGGPSGVVRRKLRGFETKHPPSTPAADAAPITPEIAMPIPGVLRGVEAGEEFGVPDTRADPLWRFLKGDLKGFRRSGDADSGAGGV